MPFLIGVLTQLFPRSLSDDHFDYINDPQYGCSVFRRSPELKADREIKQRVKDENELTELIQSVSNRKKWKNIYKKHPTELDKKWIHNIFGFHYLQSKEYEKYLDKLDTEVE